MILEDKSLLTHPILFQTPVINKQLDDNPNLVRVTNPSTVWDPSDYGLDKKAIYDPNDPPLRPGQRAYIVTQLDPIARKTLDNEEGTILFYAFMSRENVKELQLRIRKAVFEVSQYNIPNQNESELLIAMHNIYKSYANNMNENLVSKQALFKHIREELDRLDNILVKLVLPTIVNSAEQRVSATYIFNHPFQAKEFPMPVNTSLVGTREYRDIHDVLVGNQDATVNANTSTLHYP